MACHLDGFEEVSVRSVMLDESVLEDVLLMKVCWMAVLGAGKCQRVFKTLWLQGALLYVTL